MIDDSFTKDEKKYLESLHDNNVNYNAYILTKKHRELLLRDFLMIIIKSKNDFPIKRKRWPLYALLVIQKLIFIEENYHLPLLQDAHQCLQNQADVSILPIHTNRQYVI
jgi:hypothetical protein